MYHVPIVRGFGNVCYDPVTATVALVAVAGGATAYSARQERKAASKAADAQRDVARMEIEEGRRASETAAQEAKSKLKLRRASQTKTILSDPNEEANVNKSVLGVG